MSIPSEAATTKGESIEWQTREIEGTINRSDEDTANYRHPWKREAWFDTQSQAMEYLKTVLNVLNQVIVKSEEGSTSGQTLITVQNPVDGSDYKYSTSGPIPNYKQNLTEWTELEEGTPIIATNGSTLYVAQVDSDGKALGCGTVTVVAKQE